MYGSAVSVAKALERLTRKGGLVRIARGLYCYPKIDRKFGLGIQYPTVNEIAEKVARQSEARVVPTGMHALNVLGLSAQVPMNYVFYTDGNSRTVNLFNGRKLRFKRVALKNLAYQNKNADACRIRSEGDWSAAGDGGAHRPTEDDIRPDSEVEHSARSAVGAGLDS